MSGRAVGGPSLICVLDCAISLSQVHPSLIINMDQTGVHLVPASNWTYHATGASSVAVLGAEDKRQITACIASSLDGELLPLQLIFQGKTTRSLPPSTVDVVASRAHITFSDNHWSNQRTMKEYVEQVILPYSEMCIERYKLDADACIILVLDVWSVHKSEEFRLFLRTKHPRIHLVYIPPKKLEISFLPDEEEQDAEEESDREDSSDDELDISAQRVFGQQGTRVRTPAKQFGYQLASSQIAMTEDSE